MTAKRKEYTFILGLTLLVLLIVPLNVSADAEPFLRNPISCDDFTCLLVQIIRIFLGFVAITATVMFIYGGFVFLTSRGNADAVKKGKDTLFWSSVGIVIVIGSWIAVEFVLRTITGAT